MELWMKLLSLFVLQIVAAQEDYCPEEYLPPPESYPQAYFPAPQPLAYLPPSPYVPAQCSPPMIPEYIPELPVEPDYLPELPEEDEEVSLPSLPEINLCQPPPYEREENFDLSFPALSSLDPLTPPEYGYCPALEKPKCSLQDIPKYKLQKKCGKIFNKKPCASLKEKLLAKKIKLVSKMLSLLYKPSLIDKKCSLCKKYDCECPPYEEEYYPPPLPGYY